MMQTIEALIDERGRIRLLDNIRLPESKRALVTILDERPKLIASETALLSEPALAEDWNRLEENEAWSYLESKS